MDSFNRTLSVFADGEPVTSSARTKLLGHEGLGLYPSLFMLNLLNLVVEDMRAKGISPLYLLTDHTGFYERYGWKFLCMVQGDGEPEMSRMYTI